MALAFMSLAYAPLPRLGGLLHGEVVRPIGANVVKPSGVSTRARPPSPPDNGSRFDGRRFRGTFGKQLDEEFCQAIGQAYVVVMAAKGLILGHDGTDEARKICLWLAQGVTAQSADVFYFGAVSLDEMRLAMTRRPLTGAIYVGADAPGSDQHTIWYLGSDRPALHPEQDLALIARLADRNAFLPGVRFGETKDLVGSLTEAFLTSLLSTVSWNHECKATLVMSSDVDPITRLFRTLDQNGVLERMGIILHWAAPSAVDPLSPLRMAGPVNRVREALQTTQADFGVVFSNAYETPQFFDEKGEMVSPDVMMALIARNTAAMFPENILLFGTDSPAFLAKTSQIDPRQLVTMTSQDRAFRTQMLVEHATFGYVPPNRYFYAQLKGIESLLAPVLGAAQLVRNKLQLSALVADLMEDLTGVSLANPGGDGD